jgi:hypothetical protein
MISMYGKRTTTAAAMPAILMACMAFSIWYVNSPGCFTTWKEITELDQGTIGNGNGNGNGNIGNFNGNGNAGNFNGNGNTGNFHGNLQAGNLNGNLQGSTRIDDSSIGVWLKQNLARRVQPCN